MFSPRKWVFTRESIGNLQFWVDLCPKTLKEHLLWPSPSIVIQSRGRIGFVLDKRPITFIDLPRFTSMTIIWQKSLSMFFWKCQCRRRVATIESKFIFNSSNVKSKTNFAILRMKTTQNKVSFKNNCFPLISFLWKEK